MLLTKRKHFLMLNLSDAGGGLSAAPLNWKMFGGIVLPRCVSAGEEREMPECKNPRKVGRAAETEGLHKRPTAEFTSNRSLLQANMKVRRKLIIARGNAFFLYCRTRINTRDQKTKYSLLPPVTMTTILLQNFRQFLLFFSALFTKDRSRFHAVWILMQF